MPLPTTAPAVLVNGPINLTWAANHSDFWRERGVDGFIVYGLEDALSEAETPSEGDESPLLREIRVAQQRLRVVGLGRSFFHWDMGVAWELGVRDLEALYAQASNAATFARAAGLQGIALRLPKDSAALRYGAPSATHDASAIVDRRKTLHQTGLRIIRELLRAHPHGEILLLAESPLRAGRDWWALLGGMLAGPDAAPIPLHLVDLSSDNIDRALDYQERRATLHRHARMALSDASFEDWKKHGASAWCISLFKQDDNGIASTHNLETARLLSLAAAMFSNNYMLVHSPPGGLWEVTDERASAYADLAQGVPVEATTPLLPMAHQVRLSAPWTRLKRVGPYQDEYGAPVFVLQGADGAAVLFWGGLAAPTRLSSRSAMIELWYPRQSHTRSLAPEDGYIVLPPSDEPLLVRGLPVASWTLPTAMRIEVDQPFRSGSTSHALSIHVDNPMPVNLDASLSVWAPERLGVGRQITSLNLSPGAAFQDLRKIRGQWATGDRLGFQLVMTQPGAGIVTREFAMPVAPELIGTAHLPAELSAPPMWLEQEDRQSMVVVTSGKRFVSAFKKDGSLSWEYDHGAANELRPLPTLGDTVGAVVVESDDATLFLLNQRGEMSRIPAQDDASPVSGLALWRPALSKEPLVLVLRDGRTLAAINQKGTKLWERQWPESPALLPAQSPLATSAMPPPPLVLLFAEPGDFRLEALDQAGDTLWTFNALEHEPRGVLLFYGTAGWQVALWNAHAQLWLVDGESGRAQSRRMDLGGLAPEHFELRPLPGKEQVGLMLYSRRDKALFELAQDFRNATRRTVPSAEEIRGIRLQEETIYWGITGRRPLGLIPTWEEAPHSIAPTALMAGFSEASETLLFVFGGTELRIVAP